MGIRSEAMEDRRGMYSSLFPDKHRGKKCTLKSKKFLYTFSNSILNFYNSFSMIKFLSFEQKQHLGKKWYHLVHFLPPFLCLQIEGKSVIIIMESGKKHLGKKWYHLRCTFLPTFYGNKQCQIGAEICLHYYGIREETYCLEFVCISVIGSQIHISSHFS